MFIKYGRRLVRTIENPIILQLLPCHVFPTEPSPATAVQPSLRDVRLYALPSPLTPPRVLLRPCWRLCRLAVVGRYVVTSTCWRKRPRQLFVVLIAVGNDAFRLGKPCTTSRTYRIQLGKSQIEQGIELSFNGRERTCSSPPIVPRKRLEV